MYQFGKPVSAQRAAHCLGTTVDELTKAVFQGGNLTSSSSNLNRKLKTGDAEGVESLRAFVTGLYQEVFNALVFLINRSISSPNSNAHHSILILDLPGFQNGSTTTSPNVTRSATFEDLCHNYAQERLQLLFHDRTVAALHEKYVQEQIDCDDALSEMLAEVSTPAPLVALLDKQAGVRSSQTDLASADKRGNTIVFLFLEWFYI